MMTLVIVELLFIKFKLTVLAATLVQSIKSTCKEEVVGLEFCLFEQATDELLDPQTLVTSSSKYKVFSPFPH